MPSIDLTIFRGSLIGSFNIGDTVTARAVIRNRGADDLKGAAKLRFFLSEDRGIDSGDIELGQLEVSDLRSGSKVSKNLSFNITDSLTPGRDYSVIAYVDILDEVAETREGNNVRVLGTFQIPQPELSIEARTTRASGNFQPGGRITANVTVQNTGDKDAPGNFATRFYLSTDSNITVDDRLMASRATDGLAAGAERRLSAGFNLSGLVQGQRYWLGAITDASNSVGESDETNNTRFIRSFVLPKPDLRIDSASVSGSFRAGGTVNADVRIRNAGGGNTNRSFITHYYLSDDNIITSDDRVLASFSSSGMNGNTSQDRSTEFDLPTDLVAGQNYFLGVITDAGERVVESQESNNARLIRGFTAPTPNLRITGGSISGRLQAGGRVITRVNVRNISAADINNAFVTRYYLSTDRLITTADQPLGGRNIGTLRGGSSRALAATFDLPDDLEGGRTYYVGAITDSTNQVREGNEFDNKAVLGSFEVAQPDLVASRGALSGDVRPGGRVRVSVRVGNESAVDVDSAFQTRFYLSTDNTITTSDRALGSFQTSSLSAGSHRDRSMNLFLPGTLETGRRYYIGAIADNTEQVTEGNEDNNVRLVQSFVAGRPDLRVISGNVGGDLVAGGEVTANLNLRNQGPGDARTGFSLAYYLSTDSSIDAGDQLLLQKNQTALPANRSRSVRATFTLPDDLVQGQQYFIGTLVDSTGRVGEANEDNNIRVLRNFTPPRPDLRIVGSSASGTIEPGRRVTARVRVRNAGEGGANENFVVRYYLSTDSSITTEDPVFASATIGGLNAGSTVTRVRSFSLPTSLEGGARYYIGAIVDPAGRVSEIREGNNVRVIRSFIAPVQKPDIKVTGGNATGDFNAGGAVTVSADLLNSGNTSTGETVKTSFYLATDEELSGPLIQLAQEIGPSLGAGASGTAGASFNLPDVLSPSQNYFIHAVADPSDRISEINEDNNSRVLHSFTPGQADLVFSAGTASGTFNSGGSVNISVTIANQGTATALSSFVSAYYLSSDPNIDMGDTLLGVESTPALLAGGSVAESASVVLPSGLVEGAFYYIGALTDTGNTVFESEETNNTRLIRSFQVPVSGGGGGGDTGGPTDGPTDAPAFAAARPFTFTTGSSALSWPGSLSTSTSSIGGSSTSGSLDRSRVLLRSGLTLA